MRPALEMFMTPFIGITCFAVILASWFGGVGYGGVPAGLVAIAVGNRDRRELNRHHASHPAIATRPAGTPP